MPENRDIDDALKLVEEDLGPSPKSKGKDEETGFRIAGESKIPISKHMGKMWKQRKDAALVASEIFRTSWNEAYRYFNNDQGKHEGISTTKGFFHRGDSTENVVFANIQTILPAIYSKNPDIAFSTDQIEDQEQVKLLEIAVNSVIRKKTHPGIDLKPHMQKAALHTELTNLGVIKIDMVLKDDSVEFARDQMEELYKKSLEVKDAQELREIEGEMLALETTMEWKEPSGLKILNVVSSNILIDPNAERKDGLDAQWMMERCFLPTEVLNAKFTEPNDAGERALIYKPTHRVRFKATDGAREDALGPVMEAISSGEQKDDEHTNEQRMMYIYENMTECYYVWDKATRRIY